MAAKLICKRPAFCTSNPVWPVSNRRPRGPAWIWKAKPCSASKPRMLTLFSTSVVTTIVCAIALDEFGRSGRPDATLLLQFRLEHVKRRLGPRNPGADEHLHTNNHRFAVAHLQLAGHGDVPVSEQAVGHGAIQQRRNHAAVQESLKAFKGGVTE